MIDRNLIWSRNISTDILVQSEPIPKPKVEEKMLSFKIERLNQTETETKIETKTIGQTGIDHFVENNFVESHKIFRKYVG